jgi:sugar lactone lactonase YvrE
MRVLLTAAAVVSFMSVASLLAAEPEPQPTAAAYKEVDSLCMTPETKVKKMSFFGMDTKGNLLVGDLATKKILHVSPDDKLVATWQLDFAPQAIHIRADGRVYVGGMGEIRLMKLDAEGKVLSTAKIAGEGVPKARVAAITSTEKDLFVSFGSGRSLRALATIVRFDLDGGNPKEIATRLRGCCQRLDLVTRNGVLYAAENAVHRVVKYDRDGNVLAKWGKRDRTGEEGFGSCCNPMNICFGADGSLYTAESGLGRIKRYTVDGKYLGIVGIVGTDKFNRAGGLAVSCSNICVAPNADASRVFVMDLKGSRIRVLAAEPKAEDK